MQDLLTVQGNIQILLCAISLESSIKGFSSHCYGYCLLLYYSILFNIITTNQSLVVGNSVSLNFFNLAATVLLLSGESRGAPPLFLDRTETHRAEKKVFGDDPSPPLILSAGSTTASDISALPYRLLPWLQKSVLKIPNNEISRAYGLIRLPRRTSGHTSKQLHFYARNQFRIWTGSPIGCSHVLNLIGCSEELHRMRLKTGCNCDVHNKQYNPGL